MQINIDYGQTLVPIPLNIAELNNISINEMFYSLLESHLIEGIIEKDVVNRFNNMVSKIISALIFICTQQSEINGIPKNPKPKKTKQGFQTPIQAQLVKWNVAQRIGKAIKMSNNQPENNNVILSDSNKNRPRPHVRRAHWHGYWKGSKKENKQIYEIKWLAPSLVNILENDNLPAVIRNIKK